MLSLLWGFWDWLFRKEERKLVIVGIDNAGKSTTLEQLKLKYTGKSMDLMKIPPTIGLNIDGIVAICWDIGGQLNLRQLWSNYFEEVDGIIFVMDSSDRSRFEESLSALKTVLENSSLTRKPLCLFANKSDMSNAATLDDISSIFQFQTIASQRPFLPLASSAIQGTGLDEGIRWVVAEAVKFNSLKAKMVVEVFLKPCNEDSKELPTQIVELEMKLDELQLTLSKLQESTDLLTEEFRKSTFDEDAKEYYEYVQENLEIMTQKSKLVDQIKSKINAIKGIVPQTSLAAGGLVESTSAGEESGHFI